MKSRVLFAGVLLLAAPLFAQEKPTTADPRPRKDEWWQKRHEGFLARTKAGGVKVAFLGDSITQAWESDGKAAWEKAFAPLAAANYGIGGDQTQHVLWRITEGKELEGIKPKVAVIMIGTNNFAQHSADDIALGIRAIVDELQKQKKGIKILLLGVFPRGQAKDAKDDKIAAKDLNPKSAEVNKRIAKLADGERVIYLNINKKFLDKEGALAKEIMPDYLHLSPKGYEIWAKAIEEKVKELLNS